MEAMALSFAESATTSLLGKLGGILAQEAALLAGIEDEIQDLMDELESMAAFLRVLSEKQEHDQQVKTWMKQVRELAYDAEDSIDVFKHHLGRARQQNRFLDFLTHTFHRWRTLKARHVLAIDLQKLKLRAHNVGDRRARYSLAISGTTSGGISSSYGAAHSQEPPLSTPFVEELQLAEIDGRRDKVIGWLMEEKQSKRRVISLVGFGGLGKATLAKMAYESPAVTSGHFQARAWIAVSQSFEVKPLLRNMINQFSFSDEEIRKVLGRYDNSLSGVKLHKILEQKLDKMGEAELVSTVNDYLKGKRYLIVLDDVWSTSAWHSFKAALPDNKNGSSIIVTTRIMEVANTACSSDNREFIYEIPRLSLEQSRELFCKRVFESPSYTCPENLIQLTHDILSKCDGLPLALVTIAGLLATKPEKTPAEWRKFHHHLGSELETNARLEKINRILLLSYNDLPHYLKPCFLYLSIFPEDYEINRKLLVRRWMAEGFVNRRRDMFDEEVGEGYFDELISRSLILSSDIGGDGKVKSCRVHDIILEVIVSMSMEENFVTVIGERSIAIPHDKIRRLAIQGRSTVKDDLYLSQLPDSIGDLGNLQFLDTRGTGIQELPHAVVKLQRLAYLLGYGLRLPKGIGKMKGLVELGEIDATHSRSGVLREIGELAGLKKLQISFDEKAGKRDIRLVNHQVMVGRISSDYSREREHLRTSLEQLESSLRSLKLEDFSDKVIHVLDDLPKPPLLLQKIRLLGNIGNLPTRFASLDRISKITLKDTYLDLNAIQVLKNLPTLVQLVFEEDSFKIEEAQEVQLRFGRGGFEGLRILQIESLGVIFEEEALPKLELLKLKYYVRDKTISEIHHLRQLKEVHFDSLCNEAFKDKLKRSAEAYQNPPKFVLEE